jgi:Cyclin
VSGKRGSEFRLLTIALMLGNKFLDDNTYTNKTWAEVSGISVTEIHIMEVEFLSNMRYELFVSASEWKEWKNTLGRLGFFYEKALKFSSTPAPMTPLSQSFGVKLPSPPSTHHMHTQPFPGPQAVTLDYQTRLLLPLTYHHRRSDSREVRV